jgi:hypothetical protein
MAQEYLDYFGGEYGLPTFHFKGNQTTEAKLERIIERMVDKADRIFMTTDLTQSEYDDWSGLLTLWAIDAAQFVATEK